jgi:phosphoglycolate phosphatase-like HAD superfamily hydrolase
MAINYLICDWNGTLIGFSSEKPLFEAIGKAIYKSAIPFNVPKLIRMQRGKSQMDELGKQWGREKDIGLIQEIFSIFNNSFIEGTPVTKILGYIDKYAVSDFVQGKLQKGLLNIVKEFSLQGKGTAIFSAACKYPIEKVVQNAGYDRYFDFIEADEIHAENGRTIGFGLNIYGRKPELLDEIIKQRSINPDELAYIADSEDEGGCFERIKYPVVSLIASDKVKNMFSREYNAFVPENIEDLDNYLKKA